MAFQVFYLPVFLQQFKQISLNIYQNISDFTKRLLNKKHPQQQTASEKPPNHPLQAPIQQFPLHFPNSNGARCLPAVAAPLRGRWMPHGRQRAGGRVAAEAAALPPQPNDCRGRAGFLAQNLVIECWHGEKRSWWYDETLVWGLLLMLNMYKYIGYEHVIRSLDCLARGFQTGNV